MALPAAQIVARNTSTASENKIHDDSVARQYGFGGGLVPGATSYAYLASHLATTLGTNWIANGEATISLVRPVYEGETVVLGGAVRSAEGTDTSGAVELDCWVDGTDGTRRAPATARVMWGVQPVREERPDFAGTALSPREPDQRLTISASTAPLGQPLPPVEIDTSAAAMSQYLANIDDANPLFHEGNGNEPLLHPGMYPNIANQVLSRNFILNVWIHTRSEIRHLALPRAGGAYRAYGQLVDAFEKRGHEYVTADVLICDGHDQPVARMRHTAIVVVAKKTTD